MIKAGCKIKFNAYQSQILGFLSIGLIRSKWAGHNRLIISIANAGACGHGDREK